MTAALFVVMSTVGFLLDVLLFMMFARAIFSWIPGLSDSKLGDFLFTVTEWVVLPVRNLFEALNINVPMMIDIPFLVTYLILMIVSVLI